MKVIAEFENPKNCYDCPCFFATEGAWRDECNLLKKEVIDYYNSKLEDCPLKVVEDV